MSECFIGSAPLEGTARPDKARAAPRGSVVSLGAPRLRGLQVPKQVPVGPADLCFIGSAPLEGTASLQCGHVTKHLRAVSLGAPRLRGLQDQVQAWRKDERRTGFIGSAPLEGTASGHIHVDLCLKFLRFIGRAPLEGTARDTGTITRIIQGSFIGRAPLEGTASDRGNKGEHSSEGFHWDRPA